MLSSNEIRKCLLLLWSSIWWQNLKRLMNGLVYLKLKCFRIPDQCVTIRCVAPLIDHSKRSRGSHVLHNIILFRHTRCFKVCSIQSTWEAIGLADFFEIKMRINFSAVDALRSVPSLLDDCWQIHTKRSQLNENLKHTETTVHDDHSPRVVNRLCESQEKTCCLSVFRKIFGCEFWRAILTLHKLNDVHDSTYPATNWVVFVPYWMWLSWHNIQPGQAHIFVDTDIDSSKHNTQPGLKHPAESLLNASIKSLQGGRDPRMRAGSLLWTLSVWVFPQNAA